MPMRPHGGGALAPPPPVPTQASLSFKFNLSDTGKSSPTKPVSPPVALPSTFFSRQTAASKESADTMRLSAVVDELTQRLRKMSDAKVTTETQLARTGHLLSTERQAHAAKVEAMKSEMSTAHEMAMSLRSELAQRPAIREVNSSKFGARVRSALEQEETNAKVADAESRVSMLLKRAEGLNAEVKLLEGKKHTHLAESNAALTEQDIQALVKRAADAQSSLQDTEERKSSIKDDIDRLNALRDAHREEVGVAATQLEAANAEISSATIDADTARREVLDLLKEHEDVVKSIESKRNTLDSLEHAAVQVTGATAPAPRNPLIVSDMAKVETFACCHTGLPYHFEHDAPLNITAATETSPHGEESMDGMVNALITDLKSYFSYAAEAHSQIGQELKVAGTGMHSADLAEAEA